MARYRKVDPRVWNDAKFRALSQDTKTLWLFLLTAPQSLVIPGVIVGGPAGLAEVLEWTPQRFRDRFSELVAAGMCKGDLDARLIWLPKGIVNNPPENPNTVKAWSKAWGEVPECSLKTEIWSALEPFVQRFAERLEQRFADLFHEPFAEQVGVREGEKVEGEGSLPAVKSIKGWPKRLVDALPKAEPVLEKLAERTGIGYTARSKEHVTLIARLLEDGHTESDMRLVIWDRCKRWLDDPKMREYLRPSTLFARSKFAEYLPLAREARAAFDNDKRKAEPPVLPGPGGAR